MAKKKGKDVKGTVYLDHFDNRFHHAGHYLGFAEDGNLDSRQDEHRKGLGSKLVRAAIRAGINFRVVRTWENGTRSLERALKNRKDARSLCPECRADRRDSQNFSRAMRKIGVKRIAWELK